MVLTTIGNPTVGSSWLGLVAGAAGIVYGLKAKEFAAFGRFSSREREHFVPNWRYRLFVVSISAVAVLSSLRFLLKGR